MATQPSREVPARVGGGARAPGPSASSGGAEGPLHRESSEFSSVSLHGNPLFFRVILVIFFKIAFPPGEGGHGGEQGGPENCMTEFQKWCVTRGSW